MLILKKKHCTAIQYLNVSKKVDTCGVQTHRSVANKLLRVRFYLTNCKKYAIIYAIYEMRLHFKVSKL